MYDFNGVVRSLCRSLSKPERSPFCASLKKRGGGNHFQVPEIGKGGGPLFPDSDEKKQRRSHSLYRRKRRGRKNGKKGADVIDGNVKKLKKKGVPIAERGGERRGDTIRLPTNQSLLIGKGVNNQSAQQGRKG